MQRLRMLAACFALAACAPEAFDADAEFSSDALVEGHGGIVGPVQVEAKRLVIRREGNESLLGSAGRVLVGKPQQSAGNPYGFLRRARSVDAIDGDRIAITTEEASLGDAVDTGSVHASHELEASSMRLAPMSNATAAPSAEKGLDVSVGERTLLDYHTTFRDPTGLLPVAGFDITRVVKLTRAEVHFEPTVDLALSLRGGKVDRFDASAHGALEASFALSVDTKTSVKIDSNPAYRETLKSHFRVPSITVTLFETAPYILPPQWIGIVPVVETVRFRVVLECDVDLTSEMHAEAGVRVRSSGTFGVRYRGGEWQPIEKPVFEAKPTFAMTQRGSVAGMCGIRTQVGFYFYDLAGPTVSVTPYLTFDVASSPRGFDFLATPGMRGALGGNLQVLGFSLLRADRVLFDPRSTSPLSGSFDL